MPTPRALRFTRAARKVVVVSWRDSGHHKFSGSLRVGKDLIWEPIRIGVGRGDVLDFDGGFIGYSGALAALVPCVELEKELETLAVEHYAEIPEEKTDPIDTGNKVNGETWGWVRGTSWWFLVPADLQDSAVFPSGVFVSMVAGREGVATTAGTIYTPPALVFWWREGKEGLRKLDVSYNPDVQRIARRPFDEVFTAGKPTCPVCDDGGRIIRVWENSELAPGAEAYGWSRVWRPCRKHRVNGCFVNGLERLTWTGDRWDTSLCPPRRGNRGRRR